MSIPGPPTANDAESRASADPSDATADQQSDFELLKRPRAFLLEETPLDRVDRVNGSLHLGQTVKLDATPIVVAEIVEDALRLEMKKPAEVEPLNTREESPHVTIGSESLPDTPETRPARLSFEPSAPPPPVPLIVSPPTAPEMPAHRLGSESIDWDSGVAVAKAGAVLLPIPVLPEEEDEPHISEPIETAPVITSDGGSATASVNVAENGATVTIVTASDFDAGATLTYAIVGGADAAKFTIDANTGTLSFVSAPDYETPTDADGNNIYDVTVQVSDGTLTDTQVISATVTNIIDEAPVITSDGGGATASVNTAENATVVTTVTASDFDAGATLTYAIVGGADAAKFAIDANTGTLSFVSAPDYETPTDADGNNIYDVTVQVSDGTLTDTQIISATVTNINDEAPFITSDGAGATASVNIAENATAVTTVTATDLDAGSTLNYSIAGGADAAMFTVDASTGALSFVSAPDHETPTDAGGNNIYDVTVQVSDGTLTDTQAIAVTVTNLNESANAPVITSDGAGATASISVAENAAAVTTVTATDLDAGTTLTYSIVGGADAAKFTVDANTGALSFVSAPDHETPTDTGGNNVYDVTVQVSDGILSDTQAIAVAVTNVNDNTPVITSDGAGASASVNVAENATVVTTVTATDLDAGATLTYSIVGGADAARFTVNANTGALTFVSAPDYDTPTDAGGNNVYDVTVQVSDGTLTDTQAIAVTVTNTNDNAPVITSDGGAASAAVGVAENTTAVTTLTASDLDAGSILTYSIVGGADAARFIVDANTGALSFVSAPDHETPTDAGGNNIYDVTVQVSDGTLTDTQAIAVTVTNTNDNAPVITSDGTGATASVNVAENATAVTTVTATDLDAGAILTYSIVGGADAAKFTVDANTGALSFVSAPDYETATDAGGNNVYDVTVQVSDGTLTDTQAVAVTVTNTNDNAPVITSDGAGASASVNVAENATAVTTVTATDLDAGSTLTYSIVGGADAAKFTVDANTGALSFVSAPDYETATDAGGNNVYDVTVQVSDGTLTDTQAIAVTVTNTNDNAPVITSDGAGATASVNVAENATAVTTVTATDLDAGATLTYSIVGGADAAKFTVDANTGALSFVSAPDHETPTDAGGNNIYDVTVQVSDGTLTDTQAIAVAVTNTNDNAPVITSDGAGASASVNVAENATVVTTVIATDLDAGATLTYSIVGGADAAKFTVDANTGALSFVSAPDYETATDASGNNIYDVTVQVSDGTLTDTQAIAVTVTNTNDNAPVITSDGAGASASVNVAENATAVTTVTAIDLDAGSTLTYSIVGGADAAKFTVDANTGALSFVSAPDHETPTDAGGNNIYDVTVQVSDGTLTDTQAIAVTVTNTNDNAPVITSDGAGASASVNVAENATVVTTVTATDLDAGSTLTYSIVGGADAAKFIVDANTGALSFVSAPDHETPTDAGGNNIYDVTVQVSDGTLTDTQAIAVTVTNTNDNAPVITSDGAGASASVNVAENATVVTTVTAIDLDASSTLTYSIVGGADAAKFIVDANTGALSFVSAPDFETATDAGGNNVYDVTVQVSDGSLTDTQAIAVTVTNTNDNAPVITSDGAGASASVNVAENATAVTTVTATDLDAGSTLTYTIVGGADAAKFAVDTNTGVLTFVSAPDYETPTDAGGNNIYDVTVQVSDGTLTDTQAIAITVTDVSENVYAPVITSDGAGATASINVAENATAVTTVTATDLDAGSTLTYSIVGGADAAKFTIDAGTGVLIFASAPDFETPTDAGSDNVYDVTVQVSDGTLTDTQAIAVTATDIAENCVLADGGVTFTDLSVTELSVTGGTGNDTITGSAGDDNLYGGAGNDTISGVAGNDIITGGTGADTLDGGIGTDTASYSASASAVTVNLTTNVNTGGDAASDSLSGFENITGSAFNDTLTGDAGANVLTGGAGNDTLTGGAGADTLTGGSGTDTANYAASASAVTVNLTTNVNTGGDAASDSLSSIENITGSAYDDVLTGNGSANVINAGAGNDIIAGGGSGDTIDGEAGIDTVDYTDSYAAVSVNLATGGGSGGDSGGDQLYNIENLIGSVYGDTLIGSAAVNVITGGSGNDIIVGGAGADTIIGGSGTDTADYSTGTSAVTVNLATGVNTGGDAQGDTLTTIENLTGSNYNDTLTGNTGANVLSGGTGNDTLAGGAGADTLTGGSGTDTADYSASASAVTVNLTTNVNTGGDAASDSLSGIENVTGSANADTLTGDAAANVISGGAGNDTIAGRAGADTLDGGTGTADAVDYSASSAGVTVNLTNAGAQSGGDAAGDILSNFDNIIGSAYDDTLTGDANYNYLEGGAGNDTISTGAGDDDVSGGAGNDTLIGGSGINHFSGGDGDDIIIGGSGEVVADGGDGNDTITGGGTSDFIQGGWDNDTLSGGADDDHLEGGAGDDILAGGTGADTLDGGTDIDTADYSASASGVTVDLANLGAQGGGGDAAGDILSNIENLIGSAYDDTLSGNAGANVLSGGAGSDVVDYSASSAGVTVNLTNAGAQSGGDAAGDILSGFEGIFGSAYADTLTGDANDNYLKGGDGNDTISGGAGDDNIIGSAGADTLDGGTDNDTVDYWSSEAGVTVDISSAGAQSGGDAAGDILSNFEDIVGSFHDDTLTGNASDNYIEGLGGNDTISAAAGNDLLTGGAGADILDGGTDNDTVDYWSSEAGVTVDISSAGAQSGGDAAGDILSNFENLSGSSYDDTLIGNTGNNYIEGRAGNDTLTGGAGADTLDGGSGTDTADYSASASAVTVNLTTNVNTGGDAASDSLSDIENITGSAFNDTLTGDTGANVLAGGAGADTLVGDSGTDTADYSTSASAVTVNLATNVNTGGDAQDDSLATIENITGSANDDVLTGNAGANVLTGGAGNDTLTGGAGADTLAGGSGTDTANYWASASAVTVNLLTNVNTGGDAASDSLSGIENVIGSDYADTLTGDASDNVLAGEAGADVIDGGAGSDTVDYSSMAGGVGIITIDLSTGTATGGDAEGDTFSNIENITASANMDNLIGDAGDNILRGLGDHDDLDGGSGGFDILMGGAGDDNMYGGGILTVDYSDATSAVTVDISINGSQDTIGAGTDSMWGISHLTGSAYADTLTGTENDNVIRGGGGADMIDGGDRIDTASYSISASAVTVNLATNVNTGGDAQGDSLTAMENLTGSDYNDTLTGSTGINVLSGGAGNDALAGGDGNDTLIGGSGSDTLIGGDGDDVLLAGEDIVKDGLFAQTPFGGESWHHYETGDPIGSWTVVSGSVDIVNSTFFATEHGGYQVDMDSTSPGSIKQTLTTIAGHSYTVTFDLGGDFLGGDTIKSLQVSAAASSQIYTVTEPGGWSQSDIGFTYQSFTFTATGTSTDLFFASLDSGGSQAGALVANVHVTHTTADGGDILSGGAGDDFLVGAAGNDTIAGGSGADTMVGNGGIDTADYSGATGAVTVDLGVATAQNTVNDGTDTLSGFENLTGSTYADTLTGDAGDNYIDGGDGNDTLSGAGGNDIIAGGAGDDTITGGSGTDTADYSGAASAVTVDLATATAQNTVGAGTDTLSGMENLTGSAYADTLTGDGNANAITGGTGNDTISGAGGSDSFVYYMGDGNDTVTGGAAGGWTDSINLNNGTTGLGTYGVDWTLSITSGSISSTDTIGHVITLSEDAAGHIDLSNGATINFTELERVTW
jgi:Ca2+-binding RTX toxin-like protein/type III secretion system FlhB-like substrate exporter